MDWSALLGALIGASAGIIGSFISSWAQSRKDRIAFNRDNVIAAALQYLHDCDVLYELNVADVESLELGSDVRPVTDKEQVPIESAQEAVNSDMTLLDLICPKATEETHCLSIGACLLIELNLIVDMGNNEVDPPKSDFEYVQEAKRDYKVAKSAFMKRIRELTDL